MTVTPVDGDVNESEVIAYEVFPPTAQESFDNPLPNHFHPVYSEQDSEAIQLFTEYRYAESNGYFYKVSLEHHDCAWMYVTILRFVMFASSGVLTAIGTPLYFRESDLY